MKVSERISSLREENGISRQSLGNYLNVPQEQIAAWETEQSTPDFDTVMKICHLFHISYDSFLSENGVNDSREEISVSRRNARKERTPEYDWGNNRASYGRVSVGRSDLKQRILVGVVLFLLGFGGNMVFFVLSEEHPVSIQFKNITFNGFLGFVVGNHYILIFLVCIVLAVFGLIICIREVKNAWRSGR